jgi:hypothetical protein
MEVSAILRLVYVRRQSMMQWTLRAMVISVGEQRHYSLWTANVGAVFLNQAGEQG